MQVRSQATSQNQDDQAPRHRKTTTSAKRSPKRASQTRAPSRFASRGEPSNLPYAPPHDGARELPVKGERTCPLKRDRLAELRVLRYFRQSRSNNRVRQEPRNEGDLVPAIPTRKPLEVSVPFDVELGVDGPTVDARPPKLPQVLLNGMRSVIDWPNLDGTPKLLGRRIIGPLLFPVDFQPTQRSPDRPTRTN